ncbi:di-trans,poly-cis-decaprenylcistransferase [Burkholderia sp. MS389]|uniref:polyprenyl diphosphate synthase n=1 Tax=unclassified Burkholderia TaxID=2613784 RepID=UPI000B79FE1C|nr:MULTISPECIES: polyprenyl diphosphate synthase [unclassified Burkholderia]OXI71669.1 di-trans,poly-cis-decaprenylcistransferase [Burkholderia sp. AU31280]QRR15935.1 di-trans,poly-cis-decaprenylcistransferase [Burkholderia sp. MS389]
MTQELILRAPATFAIDSPAASETARPPLPTHLAVILDGNRRWADRLGLPAVDGYRAGGRNVHALLSWCEEAGIPFVTLWPLSTENLNRDAAQLRGLLAVIADVIDELAAGGRWRLHVIGDLTKLPPATAERIGAAQQRTAHACGLDVNIAVAYSGRLDLLHAVRSLIAEHVAAGTVDQLLAQLSPELIASRLYTAGQPEPDLVIRTSGEQRLSNFMLWQTAFSEFYFTPTCWPDFGRDDFEQAIDAYGKRARRFGM